MVCNFSLFFPFSSSTYRDRGASDKEEIRCSTRTTAILRVGQPFPPPLFAVVCLNKQFMSGQGMAQPFFVAVRPHRKQNMDEEAKGARFFPGSRQSLKSVLPLGMKRPCSPLSQPSAHPRSRKGKEEEECVGCVMHISISIWQGKVREQDGKRRWPKRGLRRRRPRPREEGGRPPHI